MTALDHWQSLKPETRMEMEKHARQLVRGSIIEDAAARFMAMCMAEAIGESKRRADLAPAAPKVKALVEAVVRAYRETVEVQRAWEVRNHADPLGSMGAVVLSKRCGDAADKLQAALSALAALEGGEG